MQRWQYLHTFLVLLLLGGCITQQPAVRTETKLLLDRAQLNEAAQIVPDAYAEVVGLLKTADGLHRRGDYVDADSAYQQAWHHAQRLEEHLQRERQHRSRSSLSKTEAELLEVARQRALLEDQRRLFREQEALKAAERDLTVRAPGPPEEEIKQRSQKERHVITAYTVKRGESLPQIAARPEVYAESQLWPLIYRANRDQISDPRRIWPGQILRLPRNAGPDDLAEARRFAQKSNLF